MPRGFWPATIVSAILMVGGFAALGLPGALYAMVTAPLVESVRGLAKGSIMAGDGGWLVALAMTLLVPPALPLGVWLTAEFLPAVSRSQTILVMMAGIYLWALAAMLALSF